MTHATIYKTPADLIKKCRWFLRLTQEELALKLGLKQDQISRYETEIVMPPSQVVIDLINIFQNQGICPFCDMENPWQK